MLHIFLLQLLHFLKQHEKLTNLVPHLGFAILIHNFYSKTELTQLDAKHDLYRTLRNSQEFVPAMAEAPTILALQ